MQITFANGGIGIAEVDDKLYEALLDVIIRAQNFKKISDNLLTRAGSGKTYLACSLGKEACRHQIKTKYIRLPDLLMEFDESLLISGRERKLLSKYARIPLLILDEWLMADISAEELYFLFELIVRRDVSYVTQVSSFDLGRNEKLSFRLYCFSKCSKRLQTVTCVIWLRKDIIIYKCKYVM